MPAADRFILLRHARAGRKVRDPEKDFKRRLDSKGEQVALALPEVITSYMNPETVLSSPFRRCVETVEPLAEALGLRVLEDESFTPGRSRRAVRKAFGRIAANSVVCTHGEVIAALFDDSRTCAKGAFWVVERRRNTYIASQYVQAPKSTRKSVRREEAK
jgi:phosphohistidine phosphatase SixA